MRISTYWFLLLVVPALHPPSSSGLKIAFRYVFDGNCRAGLLQPELIGAGCFAESAKPGRNGEKA